MRSLGTAVLALLLATAAQAQDLAPRPHDPVPASAVEDPADPELRAEKAAPPEVPAVEPRLAEEERPAPEAPAVADPFQRGSFWWYVGIIVVAGVILAVLL